jgi:hypothetical protein
VTKNSSDEKHLRAFSFVIHATRGLVRDQKTRRKAMLIVIGVALAFLFSGATFLQSALNPREHPAWFVCFWIMCAWLTLTAIFLAIFDLLRTRLEARREERALREKLKADAARSTSNK